MKEESLWREYFEILDIISKCDHLGMYGLNQRRIDLHNNIKEYYTSTNSLFIKERLQNITDNLDKFIDFNPPLSATDHIKPYVAEMCDKISRTEVVYYLTGVIDNLNSLK